MIGMKEQINKDLFSIQSVFSSKLIETYLCF